jgi:small subunit ribosomal protein S9
MTTQSKAIQTVGRRKTSVARVSMMPGNGKITVNGKTVEAYFTVPRMLKHAVEGVQVTGTTEKFDFEIKVHGGGISGQSGAVRLGVARALQLNEPALHTPMKRIGLLTRDPRMVERKKYGRHKARRGTQFSKR